MHAYEVLRTASAARGPRALLAVPVVALTLAAGACGDGDDDEAAAPAGTATAAAATTAPPTATAAPRAAPVGRAGAEAAALAAVGAGTVTWSGPEDDRGAAWEVEVTRPDGSEVDVLIAADGAVVKTVEKLGQGPVREGPGTAPSAGLVSRQEAERAAVSAVGGGRVTWVGREDERGAAWEVEVTRADGSEVDVLVAADGSIVR